MIVEDQSEVLAFLAEPSHWCDDPAGRIERIDTHGAAVFLCGDRALKLKRAVKFPYMDFSTVDRRRAMCAEEVRLNRRTAPSLYHGVRPVVRQPDGALAFDGEGESVDWVVDMARFDQDTLFDRMAQRHALTPELMIALADEIARFHGAAERHHDRGGVKDIEDTIKVNHGQLHDYFDSIFDRGDVERLTRLSLDAVAAHAGLIERRRENGFVRHCHGDLHLRNICLFEDRPTLFDAIEFLDLFTITDVLYDLAFLLMDLIHRDLGGLANLILNRYTARTGDIEGLALMPLDLATRASVRAHVNATMSSTQDDERIAADERREAARYLDLALNFLTPVPPRLIAVGGLSGTGKSTVAQAVAPAIGPAPGALVIRSDVTRKIHLGAEPETPLGSEAYTPEINRTIYDLLGQRAATALKAGRTVIVDAVFARPGERDAMAATADAAGVPFTGVWLTASADVLAGRVGLRGKDASDATVDVVHRQQDYDLGAMTWHTVDAAGSPEETQSRVRRLLDTGR